VTLRVTPHAAQPGTSFAERAVHGSVAEVGVAKTAELERWLKTGQYDFLQINYSLGERDAELRLLPLAQEKKVAVIANRPFAEGAMFSRDKGKPLPPWAALARWRVQRDLCWPRP